MKIFVTRLTRDLGQSKNYLFWIFSIEQHFKSLCVVNSVLWQQISNLLPPVSLYEIGFFIWTDTNLVYWHGW